MGSLFTAKDVLHGFRGHEAGKGAFVLGVCVHAVSSVAAIAAAAQSGQNAAAPWELAQ